MTQNQRIPTANGSAFVDHAEGLVQKRLSPIPIKHGQKKPAISEWPKWSEETPSNAQIASWSQDNPDAGLAVCLGRSLAVGPGPHLVAIDVDQDRYVEAVKSIIFPKGSNKNAVYVAKKGAKGETIFAISQDLISGKRFQNDQGMAIEILSKSQYTVLPPSMHPDGMAYEWIGEEDLLSADLYQLPEITPEIMKRLEGLVKDSPEKGNPPTPANQNQSKGTGIVYLGDGRFSGVEMTYPGSVNSVQRDMAAVAARWNFLNGHDDEEGRKAAVDSMVDAALEALKRSGLSEPWDRGKQWAEAASQYDRAMEKGRSEWRWQIRELSSPHSASTQSSLELKIIRPTQWQGKDTPKRNWIVGGWIPDGHVTAVYGDGGMGKTLLAQQLMTACATGKPWLGKKVKRCKALGLFCEDDEAELWRRQEAINQSFGLQFSDLQDQSLISRPGEDNILITFNGAAHATLTPLWRQLLERAKKEDVGLLVIDTAADTFGGNENVRTEVRNYLSNCLGGLARNLGCAVVMCAHPSKTGLSSGSGDGGSTAWNNTVRSRLYLRRQASNDNDKVADERRILSRKKSNYGPVSGDDIELVWKEGVFAAIEPPSEQETIERRFLAQTAFLSRFDSLIAQENILSRSPNSANYALRLMENIEDQHDVSKDELKQAMDDLFQSGELKILTEGPPSKRKQRLVRSPS